MINYLSLYLRRFRHKKDVGIPHLFVYKLRGKT